MASKNRTSISVSMGAHTFLMDFKKQTGISATEFIDSVLSDIMTMPNDDIVSMLMSKPYMPLSNSTILRQNGTALPIKEWAKVIGVSPNIILSRKQAGMSDDQCLEVDPSMHSCKKNKPRKHKTDKDALINEELARLKKTNSGIFSDTYGKTEFEQDNHMRPTKTVFGD